MSKAKTAAERYKEQGLVQFACWLHPSTIRKIKTLAIIEDKFIPEVIASRFSDVKIEGSGGKVTVRFSRQLEETN
jgi:hypothetical protein